MDRILVFKLWGDYAHFKKYYTTTSPLTFELPPPPTVIGIISAIIGLDKRDNEYLTYFENPEEFKIAVKLNSPVKKVRWTMNLVDTKHHFWIIKNRTQIRTEFLKDPSFTIYFWHQNDDIYNSLKFHLNNHTAFYSVSLGLSELLANYEYIGENIVSEVKDGEFVHLNSVIPTYYIQEKGIDFEIGKEIFQVNYPLYMNSDRIVTKRAEILFERNAKPIKCKPQFYWELKNGEKIVFF